MLKQVAEGVLVHGSEFVESNAIVVEGTAGVLLIDAGVHGDEMATIASDLADRGLSVVAGFSTHPHWDHLLWHEAFGTAPRYGTARAANSAKERLSGDISAIAKAVGIPEQVPLNLLGQITGLPDGATQIPWDGPVIRIIEHNAHAPGHAALLIEDRRVIVAGDMLSDLLIPILDLRGPADPIDDYLVALGLLEALADEVDVIIPGHGSVGDAGEYRTRIALDRVYIEALRDGTDLEDPRFGPAAQPDREWVGDIHTRQADALAQRNSGGGATG
jgi:glyoxylase-like metal-dependent hydrolase (beta-lactamase superfamily II)